MSGSAPTRLPSGLSVIVRRFEYAPVAACVLSYRLGSRNERPGQRGMSHFIEHMMFKGTSAMPPTRYWQLIKRAGGVANAFTSRDMTAYYTVTPFRSLPQVLRIEADRMRGCSMEAEEVASERQVVLEELRMTGRDNPSGALMDTLYREAFASHPYRWPVAGTPEDVEGFTREGVLDFYRRHYQPGNAVLTVCGKVDRQEVLDLAGQLFRSEETGARTRLPGIPLEEPGGGRKVVEMHHPSALRRIAIAYRVPPGDHPDTAALKMLALRLASGRTGELESALVESGLALSASASSLGGIDPGLFVISATLSPGVSHDHALEAVESRIAALSTSPLEDGEVGALARRLQADAVFAAANPAGRSIQLAMDSTRFGARDRTAQLLRQAAEVSPGKLRETAAGYLSPSAAVIVQMEPQQGGRLIAPSAEIPDELPSSDVRQPESIDLEGLEVPDLLLRSPSRSISRGAVDLTLDCGARLVVLEDHSFPTVGISLCFPMAADSEPPGMAGLTSVTAESMIRGTGRLGYRELHALLEDRGGSLEIGGGREFSQGMVSCVSETTDTALKALAEVLTKPSLRREDIARVVSEKTAEISRKHESPFGLAADNLSLIMCDPPGMARIPTEETLGAIKPEDVRHWHRLCCRPHGAVFVIVGDVDTDSIAGRLNGLLESWKEPPETAPGLSPGSLPDGAVIRGQNMEGLEQAAVLLGLEAPDRFSKDRHAMGLLNWLLGSGIGSRLGHSVRDRQGLAYAVGSAYLPWPDCGRLIVYLSTGAENVLRAQESALAETHRLGGEPVSETELRLACANMVGRHSLGHMDYGSVAHYLLVHLARGRGLTYDLESLRRTLSLSADDLLAVARRWLSPERPVFVSRAGAVPEELIQ